MMPNHVTTRCKITGSADEIKRFKNTMIGSENNSHGEAVRFLDFNKAIQMPEILQGSVSGTSAEKGAMLLHIAAGGEYTSLVGTYGLNKRWEKQVREELNMKTHPLCDVAKAYLKKNPEYEKDGRRRLAAILETGYPSWYEWSCEKWGTKWNSYGFADVSDDPFEFTFETAWSYPTPIFEKLTEMFPTLEFSCECFDEGWGFAGTGSYSDGSGNMEFCDADDDIYERVYGYPPTNYEE
jgi:hypothetical protein